MRSLILIFVFFGLAFSSPAQTLSDSVFMQKKRVMGLGGSAGANFEVNRYLSFYAFTGAEWSLSRKIKYGITADLCKLTWAAQINDLTASTRYDSARYFAFSNRVNVSGKYILRTKTGDPDIYRNYLEAGAGYNLPVYSYWKQFSNEKKVTIHYPNNFRDFYVFVKYFTTGLTVPLAFSVEYHPLQIMNNEALPNLPKLNFTVEIPIFYRKETLLVH